MRELNRTLRIGVVVALLAACSGSPVPETTTSTASSGTVPGGDAPEGIGATFLLTDASLLVPASGPHAEFIAAAVRSAIINRYPFTESSFAFQRELFADGEITRADYERAVFAAADCTRDLGYVVEGPSADGLGGVMVVVPGMDPRTYLGYVYREPEIPLVDPTICQEIWEFTISQVWLEANAPTEAEVQIWLESAWDCAREKGLPLSDPPTSREAADAVSYGCEPWLDLPAR